MYGSVKEGEPGEQGTTMRQTVYSKDCTNKIRFIKLKGLAGNGSRQATKENYVW